ncbi:MAG: SMP-30/gluconolactonase/LRE family protein [Ilumatobacteraceae bacterium]
MTAPQIPNTAPDRLEVVGDVRATLGEGPVWDERTGRVVWVDIVGCMVHSTHPGSGVTESTRLPSRVGAVAPRASGGWVAALQDGFWTIGEGAPTRLAQVNTDPNLRFNDGKCDPRGRFWAGTIAEDQSSGTAALHRLDPDGNVTRMLDGVTISNGLCWSADGTTMYYIDTPTGRVDAFAFEASSGEICDRRTVVSVPDGAGSPDGMTIDVEGGLWVAFWDGHVVRRYVDGRLDREIRLPVARVTSCTFGGPDLDELYITTASDGLTARQRRAQPLAGALFRARPGVHGVAPVAFDG